MAGVAAETHMSPRLAVPVPAQYDAGKKPPAAIKNSTRKVA